MNISIGEFDRSCGVCRRGELHWHTTGEMRIESVDPPPEIAEWRSHRKGRGRRPQPLHDLVAE